MLPGSSISKHTPNFWLSYSTVYLPFTSISTLIGPLLRQFRDFVIRNFLFESVEGSLMGLSMGWLAGIFIRRFADCLTSQSKLVVIRISASLFISWFVCMLRISTFCYIIHILRYSTLLNFCLICSIHPTVSKLQGSFVSFTDELAICLRSAGFNKQIHNGSIVCVNGFGGRGIIGYSGALGVYV